ncbi:uncharacterized mitochondrial protein-like protein [Tanacetum coccineum]
MTTANQGISVEEIEQIVAQRVANAIEAIAIYETTTSLARMAMVPGPKRQGEMVERCQQQEEAEGSDFPVLRNKWNSFTQSTVTYSKKGCTICGYLPSWAKVSITVCWAVVGDAQAYWSAIIPRKPPRRCLQLKKAESKPLVTDKRAMQTLDVNQWTRQLIVVPIITRETKRNVDQSIVSSNKKIVATESTVKKPRSIIRKLYEHVSKTCSWWHPKLTPSRYKWKPKSPIGNVNTNVSMPLGNVSRTANILEPMTPRENDYSAIATACFTQNRSLVIPRHEKTPYHIINGRKPSVKFFHIFGSLCYIFKDGENLDKMKEKGDACISVGCSTQSRAYRVYNKRTKVIIETIHVNFDELPQMASDHVSSDPVPQCPTMALEHASSSPGPQSQENVPHSAEIVTTSNKLDFLFCPMFDELLNGTTLVVSMSSAVTTADAPNQRQYKNTTSSTSTTIAADIPPLNIQTTP